MNRRQVLTAATAALVGAAASPAVTIAAATADPWRVFRVSDYEWYVARSAEEALRAAAADWGCADAPLAVADLLRDLEDDGLVDAMPDDIGDEGLDHYRLVDEDEDGVPVHDPRTFREELERRIAEGLDAPEFFAASEW